MNAILLASGNTHKAQELQRLLAVTAVRLLTIGDRGLPPLAVLEDGATFAENAIKKAAAYVAAYHMPVLADDSGLCVDALAGAPGVRSARFGDPSLDDAGRTAYLLQALSSIPDGQRGAHYVCCLALLHPDGRQIVAHGLAYGSIARRVVPGPTGFGYDPVFILHGHSAPVSRLTLEEKDQQAHRGKAARALTRLLTAGQPNSGTLDR